MANEKLMILKMLEEGKITSTEAARLLESVDSPSHTGETDVPPAASYPGVSHGYDIPPARDAAPRSPDSTYSYGDRSNRPGASASYGSTETSGASGSAQRGFNELAGDLSRKFEVFAKEMEPKLQKFTETMAEKIVSGADRISKSFTAETPHPHPSPEPRRPAPPPSRPTERAGSGLEKNIELTVIAGYNELNLAGVNGDVRVKGYNGDKITARIAYKPRRSGAAIELMKLGGKYFLNYEEDDFERVSIDAYVPERLFQVINIGCMNGNLDISSLAAREMQFSNANGQTRLAGLAAENIKADCSTGRLTLANIAANSAIVENFNGMVDASELDIARLSLTNYNGGMTLLMSAFERYADYLWSVETSNAKLTMNIPTLPDLGYHIKAHTTLGDIRVGLTGLQFIINDPALVEARSVYFDRAAKKVKLVVETSNAPLMIN